MKILCAGSRKNSKFQVEILSIFAIAGRRASIYYVYYTLTDVGGGVSGNFKV